MQEAISEGILAVSEGCWNRFPYDGCCWISHQVDSHSNQILNCVSNYMAKDLVIGVRKEIIFKKVPHSTC